MVRKSYDELLSNTIKRQRDKYDFKSVEDIKKQLKQGVPIENICQQYEVAYQTIADIRDGRSWKHVILED